MTKNVNRGNNAARMRVRLGITAAGIAVLTVVLGNMENSAAQEGYKWTLPLGLEKVPVPEHNPMTEAKVALGKQLYFDKRLSDDNTVSCATCHDPAKGWSNGDQFATGIRGQKGGRNGPTVINTAFGTFQFWDGRAGSLEEQALGPIQNPIEMGVKSLDELVVKLNKIEGYRKQFKEVFGTDVTAENIGRAIAAFERTVLSGNSPYDRSVAGDKSALSDSAKRGLDLFVGKAHCSACHAGPNFTDNAFHNIGVGMHLEKPDFGREVISRMLGDRGSFKTPTLRDIHRTGPYMHDGSMKTLEEVVEHYNKGGHPNPQLDEEIFPLGLTPEEKKDLVTFMVEGLASDPYPHVDEPKLPE